MFLRQLPVHLSDMPSSKMILIRRKNIIFYCILPTSVPLSDYIKTTSSLDKRYINNGKACEQHVSDAKIEPYKPANILAATACGPAIGASSVRKTSACTGR